MIKLTDLLFEGTQDTSRYLYHGTQRKYLRSIQKYGLLASKTRSGQKGVYLTKCKFTAKNYTLMYADEGGEEGGAILVVDTKGLDPSLWSPDNYELQDWLNDADEETKEEHGLDGIEDWSDVSPEQSLAITGQIVYLGDIPPDRIKVVGEAGYET